MNTNRNKLVLRDAITQLLTTKRVKDAKILAKWVHFQNRTFLGRHGLPSGKFLGWEEAIFSRQQNISRWRNLRGPRFHQTHSWHTVHCSLDFRQPFHLLRDDWRIAVPQPSKKWFLKILIERSVFYNYRNTLYFPYLEMRLTDSLVFFPSRFIQFCSECRLIIISYYKLNNIMVCLHIGYNLSRCFVC